MSFDELFKVQFSTSFTAMKQDIEASIKREVGSLAQQIATAMSAAATPKPEWESLATAIKTRRVSLKTLRKAWTTGVIRYREGGKGQGGKMRILLNYADLQVHFPQKAPK